MNVTAQNRFVIFSANEAELSGRAGYWHNENGWVLLDDATWFAASDRATINLPLSSGNDARLEPWPDAHNRESSRGEQLVRVRLVLDVAYLPYGLSPDELVSNLTRRTEQAIGNGMLTGNSPAEVEERALSCSVVSQPESTAVVGLAEDPTVLKEYAFDCKLAAAIRVKGKTQAEAEALLRKVFDALDCVGGNWPDGSAVTFEASVAGALSLFERDGVTVA